jgi:serine/threonine-protein kinase HipA
VWVGSDQVATLEQRRRYEVTCLYTDWARERWPANTPIVSCSLPVGDLRANAVAFCRGLLPEGAALEAAAKQAKVTVIDVFALLGHFGRDIAGALVISEDTPEDRHSRALPYSVEELDTEVAELPDRPLGLYDDSELSIAGLQNKILLVRLPDGQWARPIHGYPSTHILKADDPRSPGLVDAEEGCLQLARAVGLTTITSELHDIGDTRCLIVSRYDRRVADDDRPADVLPGHAADRAVDDHRDGNADPPPSRIHQEDMLQALGIDSNDNQGRIKYERHGGPAFIQIAELLSATAVDPPTELDRLVRIMTFNVLAGNADAHGKNLSLLHDPLGTVRLAPLYDTVPTMLWPKLRAASAMRVNGKEDLHDITVVDVVAEAERWGHGSKRSTHVATDLIAAVVEATASETVPPNVRKLIQGRSKQLLSQR